MNAGHAAMLRVRSAPLRIVRAYRVGRIHLVIAVQRAKNACVLIIVFQRAAPARRGDVFSVGDGVELQRPFFKLTLPYENEVIATAVVYDEYHLERIYLQYLSRRVVR